MTGRNERTVYNVIFVLPPARRTPLSLKAVLSDDLPCLPIVSDPKSLSATVRLLIGL
jgi:hypothetical protein